MRTESGNLLIATHSGLYRIDGPATASPVGPDRHDLMAMTVDNDNNLVASGHPDLRREDWRSPDKPPLMGYAVSDDEGETWSPSALLGDADFHAIVIHRDSTITAAESGGSIMSSSDTQSWETLGDLEAFDLTANPQDQLELLGTDYDQVLHHSTDGGATWTPIATPALTVIDWTSGQLVGVDADGTVWTTTTVDSDWTQMGSAPLGVEALLVEGGAMWVGVEGGSIYHAASTHSPDFELIFEPPQHD